MSARIHCSAPTERAFVTDKHWQTPWHREWKHGKVQPLIDEPGMGGKLGIAFMFAVAAMIGAMLALGGVL